MLNSSFLDVLTLKTRGQRLRQFVGLLVIGHNQSVQMARASDLELGLDIALANLHQLGIGSACLLEKVTDISNLLRHDEYVCKSLMRRRDVCEWKASKEGDCVLLHGQQSNNGEIS